MTNITTDNVFEDIGFDKQEGGLRRVLHLTNAIYLSGNWKTFMAGLIVMEPRL